MKLRPLLSMKEKFKKVCVVGSGDFVAYSRPELLQLVTANLNMMRNFYIFRVTKNAVTLCIKVERLGDCYLVSEFFEPSVIGAGELTARALCRAGDVETAADFVTGVLHGEL